MSDKIPETPPLTPAPPPDSPPPAVVPRDDDRLTEQLRAAMQRDRKRLWRNVAIMGVLLLALTGGALWWAFSNQAVPQLIVIAFDGICVAGEVPELHAEIEPVQTSDPLPARLNGRTVTFLDMGKTGSPLAKVETSVSGHATASVGLVVNGPEGRFNARLSGAKKSEDSARIIFVPRNTDVVIVDVQDLLANPSGDLETQELSRVPFHEPALKLLKSLQAQRKQIIYLAIKSDRAQGYRQARRWLTSKGTNFPAGPILGRPSYHDDKTEADARRQIVSQLSGHFKVSALDRSSEHGDFYRQMSIDFKRFDEFP